MAVASWASLVSPYTRVGRSGASSVRNCVSAAGDPYTSAEPTTTTAARHLHGGDRLQEDRGTADIDLECGARVEFRLGSERDRREVDHKVGPRRPPGDARPPRRR